MTIATRAAAARPEETVGLLEELAVTICPAWWPPSPPTVSKHYFRQFSQINTPESLLAAAMMLVPKGLIARRYWVSKHVPHSWEVAVDYAHGGWIGHSDASSALALIAAIAASRGV